MSNLVADDFLAEKATTIRTLANSAARDLAEIGKHLSEVKEHFGRGDNPQFLAWALDTLGWSQATIYRYLRIFEFSQTGDFINVDKIDLDVSSLYLLTAPSTTDEARAEVIEQAKTTKKVTRTAVKKTVARHAKPKAKKAAPADAVVLGTAPLIEEEAEPQYMLVKPDDTPPAVHVDPPALPAGDVMIEHLREEIAARDEEIDDLRSTITDLRTQVTVLNDKIALLEDRTRDEEIAHLKKVIDALEGKAKFELDTCADDFADFLLHYCGRTDADIKTLTEAAKEFLPEVFEALEQKLVARQEPAPPTQPVETDVQTWEKIVDIYLASDGALSKDHPKFVAAAVHWADEQGIDVEKLSGGCGAKEIWYATAKNCSVASSYRNTFHEISEEVVRRFGSGEPHSLASIVKSFGGHWAGEKIDIRGVLDMMFQIDLDDRITREKVNKAWMYTIRRPEAEEPAPQTWDQFVGTYRATDAPLPENHSKLIAGMVAWADDHGFDVEKIIGAPKEATEIWLATAKNCRGQTVAGNIQRENTAKILQRFGDGRRHSIAAMASSLSLKEKFLAVILDMMFRADFKGMVAREPDGKSLKYTIRRRTKEVAQ